MRHCLNRAVVFIITIFDEFTFSITFRDWSKSIGGGGGGNGAERGGGMRFGALCKGGGMQFSATLRGCVTLFHYIDRR